MLKRKLDNIALDTIGRRLVERSVSSPDDIDGVIANPRLFELVRQRIASNGGHASHKSGVVRTYLPSFGLKAFALSGAAVLIVIAFGAMLILNSAKPLITARGVQVPDSIPELARPDSPPRFIDKLSTGRAIFSDIRSERPRARMAMKTVYRKPPPVEPTGSDGEFYPLASAGEPGESVGGSRVIRVDMPRTSLFALGVNVPLENGPDMIRADLLIGNDGTTRAIRLVK